jgi:DNA-binding response OmpR family regulator
MGLDALYLLQAADSVSLVILDLLMPVLDGWELADELRGWRDDLPLLVVSGASGDVADSARDMGAVAFMEKPFDLNDLLDTVHALVRAA